MTPTPGDRADMDVVIAAVERGFRIAVRCSACQRWLVSVDSVRHGLGPTCRRKSSQEVAA